MSVVIGSLKNHFGQLQRMSTIWLMERCVASECLPIPKQLFTFQRFREMRNTPAVDVMYDDMIREKGVLWLYGAVLKVLPPLIPELITIYFKTRNHKKRHSDECYTATTSVTSANSMLNSLRMGKLTQ